MKLLHWIQKQRNQKDGFTLVELIVVLVILAILAALLVPALTGYIDKAKEKQVIAETRSLLTAIQTETADLYATDAFPKQYAQYYPAIASKNGTGLNTGSLTSEQQIANYKTITSLSELKALQDTNGGSFTCATNETGKVRALFYNNGSGKTCIYIGDSSEYFVINSLGATTFGSYDNYINQVIVTNTYPENNAPYDPWGRNLIFANFGL